VVDVSGVILPDSEQASLSYLQSALKTAFEDSMAKGVILRVNSPGGSPVQSDLIRNELERLKAKHDKRLVVVGEEMLTSGAYLSSMAADKIYANRATLVGSIGVRMDSFGAVDLMEKIGVERRVYTAGEDKVSLDPFRPTTEKGVDRVESMLEKVHEQFIATVKQGRGERISEDADLFTGRYWLGSEAVELGLIDGLATVNEAALKEFQVTNLKEVKPRLDLWGRLNMYMGTLHDVTLRLESAFESSSIKF